MTGPRADPDGLADRLVEVLAVPSVTGDEAALADAFAARHADQPLVRVGDSLVVGAPDDRPTVALVGHLDTVPPTPADAHPRRDGDRVVGRGASDMKAGVVVAEAAFERLRDDARYAVTLVLYAGEEGPAERNQLGRVLAQVPWLAEAGLAVVLEPTDLEVQLGCNGALHAEVVFTGRAAHAARPWLGDNALTGAGPVLTELARCEPVDRLVDGLLFRDVWTATQGWTDNARNVVPDRFTVNINVRFAPDRTAGDAERELREWVGDRAEVHVVDVSPPAPPRRDDPLVAAFVDAIGAPVTAKQAWTDVARFAQVGVPALNFGPGVTEQAHRAGEHVPVANLVAAYEALAAFLTGGSG